MAVFPDSVTLERHNGTSWVVVSGVISDFDIEDVGIQTSKFEDRLASPATLNFVVRNDTNQYDSNVDFRRKTPLKLTITWLDLTKSFYFYVTKATPSDTTYFETISVQATDWMGLAVLDLLRHVPVGQNKRIDEAVTTLLTYVSNQPQFTDFDIGVETFPIVFDAIYNGKTSVYAELYNFIISELGYMYLRNNETLVIENETARDNPALVPVNYYTLGQTGYMLDDDGNFATTEDGDRIIYSFAETHTLSGTFPRATDTPFSKAIEEETGENVLNKIIMQSQPRMVDLSVGSTVQVYTYNLYNENPNILVRGGGAITVLEGNYPEDGAAVGKTPDAAMDVATPVYATNFGFTTGPGGAASLVHTFIAGADSWKWQIQNNGSDGSITFIELFGRPIFRQQPLSYTAEDANSQEEHGTKSALYNLIYRQTIDSVTDVADDLLALEKRDRKAIKSISFCANLSSDHMATFMLTDIGDYHRIYSASLPIDKYAFVQGMKKIKIQPGGLIYYQYSLKEKEFFTPLTLNFSGVVSGKNVINFPSVPAVANLSAMSVSFWVYVRSLTDAPLVSKFDNNVGFEITLKSSGKIEYADSRSGGNFPKWETSTNVMSSLLNQWVNIMVTYDGSSTSNDPVIYIDNSAQTLTETTAPSGTRSDNAIAPLNIGNRYFAGDLAAIRRYDGKIKIVRIYDHIFSSLERTFIMLANNDDPGLLGTAAAGCVFNMCFVSSDDYLKYLNNVIPANAPVFDRINRAEGFVLYDTNVSNSEIEGEVIL